MERGARAFVFFIMVRLGLTVSHPAAPTDPVDIARLEKYIAMMEAAGAHLEPLFLDTWEQRTSHVLSDFHGLVLAGGADLPPHWYGQEPLPAAGLELVSQRRPEFERDVVEQFYEAGRPVLGICYGCQFLNVWRGGTLHQDLGLALPGVSEHAGGTLHPVDVVPGSLLEAVTGQSQFDVPSYHHQAVAVPAPDATVVAQSPDGVIEAVEWRDRPFLLGVQWHPERAPESAATRGLAQALVAACR